MRKTSKGEGPTRLCPSACPGGAERGLPYPRPHGAKTDVAALIPAIGACAGRMTAGERRLAERLEQKLDDDYLLWYDVPVGPKADASGLCGDPPPSGHPDS